MKQRLSSKLESSYVANAILERPKIGCGNSHSHLFLIGVPTCENGHEKINLLWKKYTRKKLKYVILFLWGMKNRDEHIFGLTKND